MVFAQAALESNVETAAAAWFANAAEGDLHLADAIYAVIDQGVDIQGLDNDIDGDERLPGLVDIGADDFFGCSGCDDELHIRILRNGLRIERSEGTLLSLRQIQPPSPTNKTSNTKWEKLDWHREHPGRQGLAQLCEDICTLTCYDPLVKRYKVSIAFRIPPDIC